MTEFEQVEETPQERSERWERERAAEIEQEAKDWDPEKDAHERAQTSHKTVICYNRACSDYRRERTDGSSCACKRVAITGGGF